MGTRRLLAVAALAGSIWMGGAAAPAQADCVYLTLYLSRETSTPQHLHNGCVVDTPWKQRVTATNGVTRTGLLPHNTPNGYFVDVRVPLPG